MKTEALVGWEQLSRHAAIGSATTLRERATRNRDPLPVRLKAGRVPWALQARVVAWRQREAARYTGRPAPGLETVHGWREIARLIGKTERHARTLAQREVDPLPVEGLGTRRQWAYVLAIRDWQDRQDEPYQRAARRRLNED